MLLRTMNGRRAWAVWGGSKVPPKRRTSRTPLGSGSGVVGGCAFAPIGRCYRTRGARTARQAWGSRKMKKPFAYGDAKGSRNGLSLDSDRHRG